MFPKNSEQLSRNWDSVDFEEECATKNNLSGNKMGNGYIVHAGNYVVTAAARTQWFYSKYKRRIFDPNGLEIKKKDSLLHWRPISKA
jgi:hypothetical protein